MAEEKSGFSPLLQQEWQRTVFLGCYRSLHPLDCTVLLSAQHRYRELGAHAGVLSTAKELRLPVTHKEE
ncbi:hypothetical protein AV530_018875 [Patagioenas fasciata monilis]|uniref:Uncharacterized protein n=1 Tax=Patagioenas fasciata monilis TaxID=372326 RepID=A0A1V4JJU9_PATFA|nr:hypothetical protein AV530_018875 [Patagioenas fasciata monilis]